MTPLRATCLLCLLTLALPALSATDSIRFPADAGVVDVTAAPYAAKPDDGLDDTAALQAALDAYPNGNRIVYLPRGVYDVSDTLNWPAGERGRSDFKRTILQGESRTGSILRLRDNLPAFQTNRAVVYTGPAPAQRFRNAVRNLTIEVGRGNPGADGLRFNASNQGAVRDVVIRAGEGSGAVGLNLGFTGEIGPLLVKNVTVEGFDYGIRTADAINSITLEHIAVRGQRKAGIDNIGQVFSLRGFTSENEVPALRNGDNPYGGVPKGGALTLLDAHLVGLAAATNQPALEGTGFAYLRNVSATGYLRIYQRLTPAGLVRVDTNALREFASRGGSNALQLAVRETPDVPWGPLAGWTNVLAFGAVGDGKADDTAALQRAVDSGAATVCLPAGFTFRVDGELILRGAVHRFIGTEGRMAGTGTLVVAEGAAPVVIIERMSGTPDRIRVQTRRTVVLAHSICGAVEVTGSGDLFIEDVCGGPWRFLRPGQRTWARQLNVEAADEVNVLNDGAVLWILGLKTERGHTKIHTRAGGRTEVLGAHIYETSTPKTMPLFLSENADASYACVATSCFNGNSYGVLVEDRRAGATHVVEAARTHSRTSANGKVLELHRAGVAAARP